MSNNSTQSMQTESEKFVAELGKNSFLSFWSYANPTRFDNKKELCDFLVINYPYVLIFSVKEINIKDTGNYDVDSGRWNKKAIEKSYKQIYGAERALRGQIEILDKNTGATIHIPNYDNLKYYRIGISLGRKDKFALPFGKMEEGEEFVHFFDEISFPIILQELNTIKDFTDYLDAKENFFISQNKALFMGEEDFLAYYLYNERNFPTNIDFHAIEDGLWHNVSKKEEYQRRKQEEKISYFWDYIIELLYKDHLENFLLNNPERSDIEQSLRAMSKESRFYRRILSELLLDVIGYYSEPTVRARMIQPSSGIVYVFLLAEHDETDREARTRELELRCWAARNCKSDSKEVIGIATNQYIKGGGRSFDICYLNIPELGKEDKERITAMQHDLDYFVNSIESEKHWDEYPKEN